MVPLVSPRLRFNSKVPGLGLDIRPVTMDFTYGAAFSADTPDAYETLILDSMLAIIFVSSLESVCFGLIPMTFLDGNDLYVWKRPLWAAMWGAALVWFAIAIMHPALNTYSHISSRGAIFFGLLFALLMLVAVSTWGYFRVREIRWARAEKSPTTL